MTACEEQLYARAEMLEETSDLADEAAAIYAGAGSAGVDPRAVTHLADAIRELDPAGSVPAYDAGRGTQRQAGGGYASDAELLEALSDAEEEIIIRRADVHRLREEADAAADAAGDDREEGREDLDRARADLDAAYAMPANDPCDGCHGRKAAAIEAAEAAIAAAEARIRDAERRAGICEAAAEILGPLSARLTAALESLRKVPHDLGEIYELVYDFIRRGGKLPVYARFIEGEGTRA
jgi:hypothetical protein